jgi:hypothetical protein
MVHHRRQLAAALQAQALIQAVVNPEKAADAAKAYFTIAMPVDQSAEQRKVLARELLVEEISKMAPISLSDVKFGKSKP